MAGKIGFQDGVTISIPVTDFERSIAWYQRVLGFVLRYRMDDIGWCELDTPIAGVSVGLSVVEKADPGSVTPTFGVADIRAARKSLEADDVAIDGEIISIENMVDLLSFHDPDGNPLMLFEMTGEMPG